MHISNLNRHISQVHKEHYADLCKQGIVKKAITGSGKKKMDFQLSSGSKKRKPVLETVADGTTDAGSSKVGDNVSALTGTHSASPYGNLLASLKAGPSTHEVCSRNYAVACLAELHWLKVKCATHNNVAQQILTDNACHEWREVIEFATMQSKTQRKCSVKERKLGRHKSASICLAEYEYPLRALYCHLMETRRHYMKVAWKQRELIIVGHNIWDSDPNEILGVTVFWYNHVQNIVFMFP
jgi:hypothetical protein